MQALFKMGQWWMQFGKYRIMTTAKMLGRKVLESALQIKEYNIVGVNAGGELLMVSLILSGRYGWSRLPPVILTIYVILVKYLLNFIVLIYFLKVVNIFPLLRTLILRLTLL